MSNYSDIKYPSGSITSAQLADGTVVAVDIADGSIVNSKLGAGAVTGTKITDGTINSAKLDSTSQPYSFKNRIINGAMSIWQRNTSSASAGYSCVDRFIISGTPTTVAQSTNVPAGFRYSLSLAGSNYIGISQRIESQNCSDLSGQSVTVSFWALQSAGSDALTVSLVYANSQDNFGSQTAIGATYIGLTGSWAKYSYTFASLPSGSTNGIQLNLYANGTGSDTILITGVQLEKGSTATSFDYRPYGTELALCQRYYQKSYALSTVAGTATYIGSEQMYGLQNGTFHLWTVRFVTSMRSAPAVAFYSPATGASGKARRGSSDVDGFTNDISERSFLGGDIASPTSADATQFHWTASAEL